MRIKRLTLALPAHRRGEAEALARRTAADLGRVLPPEGPAPGVRRVEVAGRAQPVPMLSRRIAAAFAPTGGRGADGGGGGD
jgi:hypothetical protein